MKEHLKAVGQFADIPLNGLRVTVEILDVKNSWGTIRYQVTPVSGSGAIWIEKILPVAQHTI